MKLPARFIAGNLVWGRDASVWAVFAVEPASYPWLARHEKLQLHQQTRAALRTLTGNAIVLSVYLPFSILLHHKMVSTTTTEAPAIVAYVD